MAEISGDSTDIQRAIQDIENRCSSGGGFRARDESSYGGNDRQQSNSRDNRQDYSRSAQAAARGDDDEWDNATSHAKRPVQGSYVKSNAKDDEWEMESEPSVNQYKVSSQSHDRPRRYGNNRDRDNSGSGSRSHSSNRGGYDNQNEDRSQRYGGDRYNSGSGSRSYSSNRGGNDSAHNQGDRSGSNYSSGNRIPYRSHDNPPPSVPVTPPIDNEVIDWDAANAVCEAARKERWAACPRLIKDFYVEHPEVTNMTEEDVAKFRLENKNISIVRTFEKEGCTEQMPKPTTKFEHAFEKYPDLMAEILKAGFEKPSPIQAQMWPVLLRGEDCIGIAQTGTGKTLAFLLPALIHTDGQPHARGVEARGGPNVLVLAPTRELAIQIEKEVAKYQFRNIRA